MPRGGAVYHASSQNIDWYSCRKAYNTADGKNGSPAQENCPKHIVILVCRVIGSGYIDQKKSPANGTKGNTGNGC